MSNPAFKGLDTPRYRVCVQNITIIYIQTDHYRQCLKCRKNSTVAADDIAITGRNTPFFSANVLTNDSDPENEAMTVTPQGSSVAPIIVQHELLYHGFGEIYTLTLRRIIPDL